MKKIFIISPHFPPSALPPSQRVRLLVKHFRKFDVLPVIFTVKPRYREELEDEWMTELLGNDFELHFVKCFDFRKTRKFGFGDLGLRMLPFLLFKLLKEIKKQNPDFILYPVPPWNLLIIAPFLKLITGVKYAVDYIDPWVVKDKNKNFKQRFSQFVARSFEKSVLKNASLVFSVSEGINSQLLLDYPFIKSEQLVSVPYGGEVTDYTYFKPNIRYSPNEFLIRYIGGIGPDMIEVAEVVMASLKNLEEKIEFKAEFIGTSYAANNLAKSVLREFIKKYELSNKILDQPIRVSYKEAVQMSMQADCLILFGGMKTYYAASKLMGMLLSGIPFIAFVHEESFPAHFLKKISFSHLVTYSGNAGNLPMDNLENLTSKWLHLLNNLNDFNKIDLESTELKQYTAEAMTLTFKKNLFDNEKLY